MYPKLNLNAINQGLFYKWAGLEVQEAYAGEVKISLKVEDHHRGGGGTRAVNGGIAAYMMDGLLGMCDWTLWDEDTIGQVTVTLNINYLSMLEAEHHVVGVAKVLKRGKSTVFMRGEIYNDAGEVAVECTGIYRLRQRKR